MKKYYLDGEEQFGPLSSFFYSLCAQSSPMTRLYAFIIDDIGKNELGSILDVGTGPGRVPIMLAKNGCAKRIYAIDPSPNMIKIAKSKSKDLGIVFAEGSSRNIPFKNKFDLIISSLSFHHWQDKEGSLDYLKKFLNRNGEIRIYEHEKEKLSGIRRYFGSAHSFSNNDISKIVGRTRLKLKNVRRKDGLIRFTLA